MNLLSPNTFDVVILGAGASGLMCALEAGKRQRSVLVIDHAKQAGQKIRISGGGRCNFTNKNVQTHNYLSENPHFCKSALTRFTQWQFVEMVKQAGIPFEERTHGQLFCTGTANAIVAMLVSQCEQVGVQFWFSTEVGGFDVDEEHQYILDTSRGQTVSQSLVVATGGLSYSFIGASGIGYEIAKQVDITVHTTTPGLVPLNWSPVDAQRYASLSGIAIPATLSLGSKRFTENLLFTHRGISGPAALQISNHWTPKAALQINLLPGVDVFSLLKAERANQPQKMIRSILGEHLPKRLLAAFLKPNLADQKLVSSSDKHFQIVARQLQQWSLVPAGYEGYQKAEVTRGGVDCNAISSKTMEALNLPGLYFIGEVLDVTGWLGGYNLQWAWSSGWCAGQYV